KENGLYTVHINIFQAFTVFVAVYYFVVSLTALFDHDSGNAEMIKNGIRDDIWRHKITLTEDQALIVVAVFMAIISFFAILCSLWSLSTFWDCYKQLK
ncbi:hypothetical protein PFISCL1PPCAC_11890, partial [Pristionchus fissidentatus]